MLTAIHLYTYKYISIHVEKYAHSTSPVSFFPVFTLQDHFLLTWNNFNSNMDI